MKNDLKKLLQFESLLSTPSDGAPFGRAMKETLDFYLDLAKSYNLTAVNMDGYCGYVEYGEGENCIGILCHLDVVPKGNGWTKPAYDLTEENGFLFGRGVVDDKGPAIVALHLLKRLKSENIKLSNRIRIIVGCNEENGSECIAYYKDNGEIPKMSIVPDADFPIINSEKGILHLELCLAINNVVLQNIEPFSFGLRPNIVPDSAEIIVKKDSDLDRFLRKNLINSTQNSLCFDKELAGKITGAGFNLGDFFIDIIDDKIRIKTQGISGHAMKPNCADNAVWKMFCLFKALSGILRAESFDWCYESICKPHAASVLDIDFFDEKSGSLTINLGQVKLDENSLVLTLDIRHPICINKDKIIDNISAHLPKNASYKIAHYAPNLYIDESSQMVKTLLNAYTKVTGLSPYCVKTGGGTYARSLPNSIAFGPTFPEAKTNIHNADECISTKEFELLSEIYYQAILALDKI